MPIREEVRLAAETMAKEELEHVAAFRRERRKAYHDAKASGSHVSEQIEAYRLEERLASRLNEIELEHPAVADRIRTLVDQTRAMAGRARELSIRGRVSGDGSAEALGESLAEIYLQAADASRDERALPLIQELAEGAVVRLSKLRSFPLRE